MKRKIKYCDEPIEATVIKDFLPSPNELAGDHEKVKVTLNLTKNSVDYFKTQARKQWVHYQTMIRNLIDYCAANRWVVTVFLGLIVWKLKGEGVGERMEVPKPKKKTGK